MKDIALVLCGGGGKGAYHIGMWRAFDEWGITDHIAAISGASVGALNAVLFAICSYKEAKNIWLNIDKTVLLSPAGSDENSLFTREGLEKIMDSLDLKRLTNSIPVYVSIFNTKTRKNEYVKLNGLSNDKIKQYLLASSAIPIAQAQWQHITHCLCAVPTLYPISCA